MIGVLDHVQMKNTDIGLYVAALTTSTINLTVSDSVIANNGITGIGVISTTGAAASVMVRNCTIVNNTDIGLATTNSGAQILVTRSTITGNGTAWSASGTGGGGAVTSYADNNIDGNGTANSEPPSPLTYH